MQCFISLMMPCCLRNRYDLLDIMASNKKSQARSKANKAKGDAKFEKVLSDIRKITSTGDLPSHYVGGGQPFTRGKKTA